MYKLFKITTFFLTSIALLAGGIFAFGRDTAVASFVVNSWQGYKLTSGLVGYYSFDGRLRAVELDAGPYQPGAA